MFDVNEINFVDKKVVFVTPSFIEAEFDEGELMQYTGLKDKNGKEIYEGDIISSLNFTGQVFWNDFSCGYRFGKTPEADIERTAYLNKFASSEYLVIGNIYENPELIKKT